VRAERDDPLAREVPIDPRALADLKALIDVAHARGVRVLAYYFPNSLWRSETAVESGAWARYQAQVRTLLNRPTDVVWDMMGPEYIALPGQDTTAAFPLGRTEGGDGPP
jgi:hypothetical protein